MTLSGTCKYMAIILFIKNQAKIALSWKCATASIQMYSKPNPEEPAPYFLSFQCSLQLEFAVGRWWFEISQFMSQVFQPVFNILCCKVLCANHLLSWWCDSINQRLMSNDLWFQCLQKLQQKITVCIMDRFVEQLFLSCKELYKYKLKIPVTMEKTKHFLCDILMSGQMGSHGVLLD